MTATTDVGPVPATRTPEGEPRRPRKERGGALLALAAWIIGFLFVVPVLWMVLTSFHSEEAAATNPPSLAAPLTLEGYRNFFGATPREDRNQRRSSSPFELSSVPAERG